MSPTSRGNPVVCLVRPPGVETFRIGTSTLVPPLGLAYIAGALEANGCRVHVIDALAEAPKTHTRYFQGYLVGLALADVAGRVPADARVVGIACMFTHEWPMVVHLVRLIKERRPDVCVVVGGEHVTAMPEFSLVTSRADVLVLGEGEETTVELVAAVTSETSLDAVEGIAFRRNDEIVVNRRRARHLAIDDIPRPAWHRFDLKTYHEHRFVGGVYSSSLTVPMLATRGCPYQCTYCSSPNMWTTRWIARDPSAVADEMEHYIAEYGAGNFPFYDLTAVIQKEWIVAFCREIIARKLDITWQLASGTRYEAIDDEVAELLKGSGMINMAYAPETGSDLTRRDIKKKIRSAHQMIPAASYSDQLGRFALFYWKLRFVLAFYLTRLGVLGMRAVLAAIAQALSGRTHSAKLQTGVRVALRSGLGSVKTRFGGSRWMSPEDETRLFAPWDAIYQQISRRRREAGVEAAPPLDSRELQKQNVIHALRLDHDVSRRLRLAEGLGPP